MVSSCTSVASYFIKFMSWPKNEIGEGKSNFHLPSGFNKKPFQYDEYILDGHSGIAGPWAWTLDSEMLDSGPIFPEISAQKHLNTRVQSDIFFLCFWIAISVQSPAFSESKVQAQGPAIPECPSRMYSSY